MPACFVLLAAFVYIQHFCKADEPEQGEFYQSMKQHYMVLSSQIKHKKLLFVGDSLIQRYCVNCFFSGAINLGIGRDTTSGLMARLDDYKSAMGIASGIIILIGHNDFKYRTYKDIVSNYRLIMKKLPPKIAKFIIGILPVSKQKESDTISNKLINRVNTELRKNCRRENSCYYINPEPFKDNQGYLKTTLSVGDGTHLNAAGYAELSRLIKMKLHALNINQQK